MRNVQHVRLFPQRQRSEQKKWTEGCVHIPPSCTQGTHPVLVSSHACAEVTPPCKGRLHESTESLGKRSTATFKTWHCQNKGAHVEGRRSGRYPKHLEYVLTLENVLWCHNVVMLMQHCVIGVTEHGVMENKLLVWRRARASFVLLPIMIMREMPHSFYTEIKACLKSPSFKHHLVFAVTFLSSQHSYFSVWLQPNPCPFFTFYKWKKNVPLFPVNCFAAKKGTGFFVSQLLQVLVWTTSSASSVTNKTCS